MDENTVYGWFSDAQALIPDDELDALVKKLPNHIENMSADLAAALNIISGSLISSDQTSIPEEPVVSAALSGLATTAALISEFTKIAADAKYHADRRRTEKSPDQ